MGVCLGRGEDLSETQDDEGTWMPTHCQRRRKRQRKKVEPSRARWNERWREGGREVPRRERARDDMRERRRRRILSEPCEPASSSDECPRTSRAHHKWSPDPWNPSPGRRHRFQPPLLSPPPGFADRKAPLWESPSLDSLGSLLSQSPDERPSTGTDSSPRHTQGDMVSTQQVSTLVQVGSCSSCYTSEKSLTVSPSHTPDSSRSYILSDATSDSFTLPSDSQPRCLCPGFPGNTLSTSSTCSVEQSSTFASSPCSNSDSDSGCFRAKLVQNLNSVCVRSAIPYTSRGTEAETTSDSCYTLTRSFDALNSISILSCLCGRKRTDKMKDCSIETSSLSLNSSTDPTCTSASSSYTVTRSFDSLCGEDIDSQVFAIVRANSGHCSDSYSDSVSTVKLRGRVDSSVDGLSTNNDSDSSYLCINVGRDPSLSVTETYSDSRCSSSETVFRSDSSYNTVCRSFDSLCVNDDPDSVYVCMNRRKGSIGSCSSTETARDSDSSLYSVERSLDSPYLSERPLKLAQALSGASQASTGRSTDSLYRIENTTALCASNTDTGASQSSLERNGDSLYLSDKTVTLCTCNAETRASQLSLGRRTDSLYRSENFVALCTCNADTGGSQSSLGRSGDSLYLSDNTACRNETEASHSSVEVYPNLYCSETDMGLTSAVTSAVTSDHSACDSSCGCGDGDSDSLSTSAIAEWGSVSLNDGERSSSASTPSTCNHGNISDCPCRAPSDLAASSPSNSAERDAADTLARTLEAGMTLDSPAHLATHLERVLKDLRGLVTQSDRRLVSPFFRELVKEAGEDRDREKMSANEGFLFHPQKVEVYWPI